MNQTTRTRLRLVAMNVQSNIAECDAKINKHMDEVSRLRDARAKYAAELQELLDDLA